MSVTSQRQESKAVSGTTTADQIELRPYRRADLDAMFQLDEICFADPFRFSRVDMQRSAKARKAQVLVAECAGELAGFIIVHAERAGGMRIGYLLTLDVAPAFRRRGLGKMLMERAERESYAAACAAMLLHVFTENVAAIRLYERLGYVRVDRAEAFYSEGRDAWVYRKELTAAQ